MAAILAKHPAQEMVQNGPPWRTQATGRARRRLVGARTTLRPGCAPRRRPPVAARSEVREMIQSKTPTSSGGTPCRSPCAYRPGTRLGTRR